MSDGVNKVFLLGNLGKDPEVRTARDGSKVVILAVATSEIWTDRASGERKDRIEWHRVVIFNTRIGDVAERFLRKGSRVWIEGALQNRTWMDQSGLKRYSTTIVISRFKGDLTMEDSRWRSSDGTSNAPSCDAPKGRELDDKLSF